MTTTRYTQGDVTVTVTDDVAAYVEELARNALPAGLLDAMLAEANAQAGEARSAWYAPGSGVTRRSGRSGDIEVTTTVSDTEVRVSVGSVASYAQ